MTKPTRRGVLPRRALLLWVMVLVPLCPGCVTFPKPVQSAASDDGIFTNWVVEAAGWAWMDSKSWLPGGIANGLQISQTVSCVTPELQVRVDWSAWVMIARSEALDACRWALHAAQYVLQFLPQYNVPIEPHVALVPRGVGMQRQTISFHPPGPLKPFFLLRWHGGGHLMQGNLVDTVAHELFHVFSNIQDVPRNRRSEERMAYVAGSCAQLAVNGAIFVGSVVTGKVPDSVQSFSARVSMQANRDRYEKLRPWFDDQGWIRQSSEHGRKLRARCNSVLAEWFHA